MSAPALFGCAVVSIGLALPVIIVAGHVEASHIAAVAADAAALAAADALHGWHEGEPCGVAADVAAAMQVELVSCDLSDGTARVVTAAGSLVRVEQRARAGALGAAAEGPVGANGWAWPSETRGVTQGHHDGFAIDLAVGPTGALYAPYDGVVVAAGPDGGSVPAACMLQPGWWHGPNVTVIMRHEVAGAVLHSSHNHLDAASLGQLGIAPGTRVVAGQQVARAGMSGCTSGPHTHFTLASRPTNAFPDVDPYSYLGPP